jgi:hypothetical protein
LQLGTTTLTRGAIEIKRAPDLGAGYLSALLAGVAALALVCAGDWTLGLGTVVTYLGGVVGPGLLVAAGAAVGAGCALAIFIVAIDNPSPVAAINAFLIDSRLESLSCDIATTSKI